MIPFHIGPQGEVFAHTEGFPIKVHVFDDQNEWAQFLEDVKEEFICRYLTRKGGTRGYQLSRMGATLAVTHTLITILCTNSG